MPSILSHYIFAQQVLNEQPLDFQKKIQRNRHLYDLGSLGPDFLFFYHALPWDFFKSHKWNNVGGKLHSAHTNAFYEQAISLIVSQDNTLIKDQMFAYLCGHINHWAMDAKIHPYIYYHSGTVGKRAGVYHHIMESNIDAALLQLFYHQSVKAVSIERLVAANDEQLLAIYNIYAPIIATIFNKDISFRDIKLCFSSWYRILLFLKDHDGTKKRLLTQIEKALKHPHVISSHIIPSEADPYHDVLNIRNREWNHPCFAEERHHESFLELFYQAKKNSAKAQLLAYQICYESKEDDELMSYLNNASYTRGYDGTHKMNYFHNIYQRDDDYADF